MKCLYCSRVHQNAFTKMCDGCWEVASRLPDFLRSPPAIKFVLDAVAARIMGDPDLPKENLVATCHRIYEVELNRRLFVAARRLAVERGRERPALVVLDANNLEPGFLFADQKIEIRASQKNLALSINKKEIHASPAIEYDHAGQMLRMSPELREYVLTIAQS